MRSSFLLKDFSLKRQQTIKKLFQKGKNYHYSPLVFRFLPATEFKFLISVSRHDGNAVYRNLIKRRIREVIKQSQLALFNFHCAIFINKNYKTKNIEFKFITKAIECYIYFLQNNKKN